MPRHYISSTFWLSGIFAAAATFDAGIKIKRREKWDRAIGQVKRELGQSHVAEEIDAQYAELMNEEGDTARISLADGEHQEAEDRPVRRKKRWKQPLPVQINKAESEAWDFSSAGREESAIEENEIGSARHVVPDQGRVTVHPGQDALTAMSVASPEKETITKRKKRRKPTSGFMSKERKATSSDVMSIITEENTLRELEANVDSSRSRPYVPYWPASTQPALETWNLPPQSIYSTPWAKTKAELRRWTPHKLETVMLHMDYLQLRLFDLMHQYHWEKEAAAVVPPNYGDLILTPSTEIKRRLTRTWEDVLELKFAGNKHFDTFQRSDIDTPICQYYQDEQGRFHEEALEMNRSIRSLFQSCERKEISLPAMLGKVLFNLSSSSAPPNIDTFNTMLVGFANLELEELFHETVWTYRCAKMRPNEVTLATQLNFYTKIGSAPNFRHLVELMRGNYNSALMEAKPDINITETGAHRLKPMPGNREGRVLQLPYPTPMVFGALIKGLLKFSGFEPTLEICQGMSPEGWGLCIKGFGHLLQDCADRADWESGLAVWKQIQALKWKSRKNTGRDRWIEETIPIPTFTHMLRLCRRCSQRDIFEDVMDQASRAHPQAVERVLALVKADRGASPLATYPALLEVKGLNGGFPPDSAQEPTKLENLAQLLEVDMSPQTTAFHKRIIPSDHEHDYSPSWRRDQHRHAAIAAN